MQTPFAEHLSTVFKSLPRQVTNIEEKPIRDILNAPYQLNSPIKNIKLHEKLT